MSDRLIYHKTGKIFKVNGKKYCFQESYNYSEVENCISCSLDNNQKLCYRMRCSASERPDNKNTIVKEITENDNSRNNKKA